MNYILNSIDEIQKIYTPDIQYLNDDFMEHLYEFKLSKKVILESMRFYQYMYCGDEYEKEHLALKEFNFENKNHKYKGINYEYLIKNIDLKVFETELDKLLTIEENRFVLEIKEELEKGNNIAFEMRLNNDVDNLLASI